MAACVAVLRTLYAGRVQHGTGEACYTQDDDGSRTGNSGCAWQSAAAVRSFVASLQRLPLLRCSHRLNILSLARLIGNNEGPEGPFHCQGEAPDTLKNQEPKERQCPRRPKSKSMAGVGRKVGISPVLLYGGCGRPSASRPNDADPRAAWQKGGRWA